MSAQGGWAGQTPQRQTLQDVFPEADIPRRHVPPPQADPSGRLFPRPPTSGAEPPVDRQTLMKILPSLADGTFSHFTVLVMGIKTLRYSDVGSHVGNQNKVWHTDIRTNIYIRAIYRVSTQGKQGFQTEKAQSICQNLFKICFYTVNLPPTQGKFRVGKNDELVI